MSSLSVVIPCYNYGHYLEDAVSSALYDQDGVDVRVLVIDDASTDDSAEVAHKLAARDSRIDVLVHETNRGHIATYNEGLAAASTDYLALLSADDMLAPGALHRATALLDAESSVGLVYGRPRTFWGEDPPPAVARRERWHISTGVDWIGAQARRGQSCIYSPEAVVRTDVQHAVGGYNAELPHTADLEMWLRVAAAGDVGYIGGPDQAYRRMHPRSMMQTSYADELVDIQHRRRAYESFFGSLPQDHPALAHERSARRRLAEEALEDASGLLVRNKKASRDDVKGYLLLAAELGGDVTSYWQWHELRAWLQWRTDHDFAAYAVANALTSRRRVEHRLRRYRWRIRGI